MPSRVKQRTAANDLQSVTATTNEKILKECHDLYVDEEKGLIDIAEGLGLELLAPRKKINILLLGNHSAGKSSFINWYVEEHIQRTGVAIETQGFSFITSGRKRESLTGNATLHLYPHFKQLQDFEGVVEYLTTEVSTSKQKKFSLVTFVDTPGLVDGDMKYPFDVDRTILWLGDRADLIFVFFDPIGQALCKRTLNLVEKLNDNHPDLIKFYLSKADTAGHESDRQRVLMQITQELCKRPGLNKAGFDMPTIFIPSLIDKPARCANQIEDVCKDIEKTINQTIQNTLNQLEKDCDSIGALIDIEVEKDRENSSYNLKAHGKKFIFSLLGVFLPFLLLVNFLASSKSRADMVESVIGKQWMENIHIVTRPVETMWASIPIVYHHHALGAMIFVSLLLLIIARYCSSLKPTLTRRERRQLEEKKNYVQSFVKTKKEKLYHEYLQQSIGSHEL